MVKCGGGYLVWWWLFGVVECGGGYVVMVWLRLVEIVMWCGDVWWLCSGDGGMVKGGEGWWRWLCNVVKWLG